jgi:hypothetical protein
MAYPDDFISALSGHGVTVAAGDLPSDENTLSGEIDKALNFINSLDGPSQAGLQAATQDTGQAAVALSAAGIADLQGLFNAFDQVSGDVASLLNAAKQALQSSGS